MAEAFVGQNLFDGARNALSSAMNYAEQIDQARFYDVTIMSGVVKMFLVLRCFGEADKMITLMHRRLGVFCEDELATVICGIGS